MREISSDEYYEPLYNNEKEQNRQLMMENERLEIQREKLQQELAKKNKQQQKYRKQVRKYRRQVKTLRTILIGSAAVIALGTVGVANFQKLIQRNRGTKSVVADLEENNIFPEDLKYIIDDVQEKVGISYTTTYDDNKGKNVENWDVTIEDYCEDIYTDGCNDGYTPVEIAIGFDAAGFPIKLIKNITGCDKEQIKDGQFKAYYEMKAQEKSEGGISR